MLAKAYFELGEYKLAVKASEEAPESEKSSLDFLTVWRDSILCNDIRASLTPLNKYFQIAKKKIQVSKKRNFFNKHKRRKENFIKYNQWILKHET